MEPIVIRGRALTAAECLTRRDECLELVESMLEGPDRRWMVDEAFRWNELAKVRP